MKRVLILDTETTGIDPAKDRAIEVGAVLWSVEHRTIDRCYSAILRGEGNAAEAVNGIPAAALPFATAPDFAWDTVGTMAGGADAFVAHSADFDRGFTPEPLARLLPWICTIDDVQWPRASDSRSLVALALAHGLGISHAHRALTDCLTIARLLERVAEMGHDVGAMLARGLRLKAKFQALVSYETNALAKTAGFRWDAAAKIWWRKMAVDDVAALPFKVRQVA
jgi:DNA polymerase-3 subunit epsilon